MPENKHSFVLPAFFDKNPELKERLFKALEQIPPEERLRNFEMYTKFISGEMTWAEIKKFPKVLLKELAKAAYLKFQMQDYKTAESLFKGLALIDHMNWYHRAALGAIAQKQKLFDQAIEEYTLALSLKSDEVTSLINRGECHLRLNDLDAALQDFQSVLTLPLDAKSSFKKRAELLSQKIIRQKAKG